MVLDLRDLVKHTADVLTEAGVTVLLDPRASAPMDSNGVAQAYAVIYTSTGSEHDQMLEGDYTTSTPSVIVVCGGGTRERALWAAHRARTALHGHYWPNKTGVWRHVASRDLALETGKQPPVWSIPVRYDLTAV